jgi:DNA-directed RNA polymerase subunit RPC12/RpoP
MTCKHRYEPTNCGIKYHYRCTRCGGTIFATLKEDQ